MRSGFSKIRRTEERLQRRMTNSNHQNDINLLLSFQDRVLETPPGSPPGYLSDDERPKKMGDVDMSCFRDAVEDCLDYDSITASSSQKRKLVQGSKDAEIDKFSGLRIQNQVVSRIELSNHLSDIRFVRLPAIKNLLVGDTLSGCWATIGVLTEKGMPRTSSIGKPFAIWQIGCLDDQTISLFLFGDAYEKNCGENVGAIFALFNCSARRDKSKNGFSLSIFSAKHILKLGTSADMGLCQAKGKDGMPCTSIVNKRRRKYCNYHKQSGLKKYISTRTELKGGNLRTGFKDYLKSEGIYVVNPMGDKANLSKSTRPVKLLSVDGLKKALSNADKVTTNRHSQGIRFLSHVTGKEGPKSIREAAGRAQQQMNMADHRFGPNQEPATKKQKIGHELAQEKERKQVAVKMIELDFASSDEEL